MWQDYEINYDAALRDDSFLSWREIGARQKASNIVRVCSSIKVKSVLEIGSGTGVVLRFLHAMDFADKYACIDIAFAAVKFVRESYDFTERAIVGLADALPFQDAVFDLAILSHVVEHLGDPVLALREASRVARLVVVEVPTEEVLSNIIRTKILNRPYSSSVGAGHLHFWSPSSISSFLQKDCGLRIIQEHRDLISKEVEFFGKKGFQLAKPLLKQTLKAALPNALYARILTTHATFLCARSATDSFDCRNSHNARVDVGRSQSLSVGQKS